MGAQSLITGLIGGYAETMLGKQSQKHKQEQEDKKSRIEYLKIAMSSGQLTDDGFEAAWNEYSQITGGGKGKGAKSKDQGTHPLKSILSKLRGGTGAGATEEAAPTNKIGGDGKGVTLGEPPQRAQGQPGVSLGQPPQRPMFKTQAQIQQEQIDLKTKETEATEGVKTEADKKRQQAGFEERKREAKELGLDPQTPEYKDFVLTGNLPNRMKEPVPKKIDADVKKGSVVDEDGNTYSMFVKDPKTGKSTVNPQLPAKLRPYVDSALIAEGRADETKANDEARRDAQTINRILLAGDQRMLQVERTKVLNDMERGIAGHSFLQTIEAQNEKAKTSGPTGPGDRMLAESWMQLMFGADPKALRGSPAMLQTMLKQGGWSDQFAAHVNSAVNGGQLSQDVRDQMLETGRSQVQSFDYKATKMGELVDDPKTKKLIQNYNEKVAKGSVTVMFPGNATPQVIPRSTLPEAQEKYGAVVVP